MIENLKWQSDGLMPAIIQDDRSDQVLMLGYVNAESLERTKQTNRVCFFSRSRQQLWTKGETSGNTLEVVSMALDCDQDALLIRCNPKGPICHTGEVSCFGSNEENPLTHLEKVLNERMQLLRSTGEAKGYTGGLFAKHEDRLLKKITEEAGEVILAAKSGDLNELANESADLLFHLMMVLVSKGIGLEEVLNILKERQKP